MTEPKTPFLKMTCDECAEDFSVGIGGKELIDIIYSCPKCRIDKKFTPDEISQITLAYGNSILEAEKLSDKLIRDITKK